MNLFLKAFGVTTLRLMFLTLICILFVDTTRHEPNTAYLLKQRHWFLQATNTVKNGWTIQYQNLKWKLHSYPLLPYLEYKEAVRDLNQNIEATTKQFLRQHPKSRLTTRLRWSWLTYLASQQRWSEFLSYIPPSGNLPTKLHCHKINALIATGKQQQAFTEIVPLWLVGKSQSNACDPAFLAWHQAGKLTEDLVWQRIALAMQNSQIGLVKYLQKFLAPNAVAADSSKIWVQRWLKVYTNPSLILNTQEFAVAHPWRETILLFGLKRLAYKKPRQTPAAWNTLKNQYTFSESQLATARHTVALAYLRFASPRALNAIADIDGIIDVSLQKQRILIALMQGNWSQVLTRIDRLPAEERAKQQWQYWQGRALQKLKQHTKAKAILAQVAQDRSYYAFLAADHSGFKYYLVNKPLQIDSKLLKNISQQPSALRAKELRAIGWMTDARLEWGWLTRGLKIVDLKAAAYLAQQWRWHDQAIFTLARSKFWDDLNLRFPLEHLKLVKQFAKANKLPIAWVLAVMRQESAFAADAISPAGAQGLMQLMLPTARQVAKRLNLPEPSATELLDPTLNIQLGTSYLRQMQKRFAGNMVLATAAYNAGPRRVTSWLPKTTLNAEIWVEKIPFSETRNYVRRVLTYMILYEKLLGKIPGSIVKRMPLIRNKVAIRSTVSRRN